jgi:DNA-binding NarL/FixJ family response regulator
MAVREVGVPMRLVAEVGAPIRAVRVGPPADPDASVAIVDVLADDIEIVMAAWPPARALETIVERLPDIVLIDYDNVTEALDLVYGIRARFPLMKVVVIGPPEADDYMRQILRVGARAYLSRTAGAEDLAAALRAIQGEHTVLDADASRTLFGDSLSKTPLRRVEVQVLRFLSQGLTYDEMTARLEISRSTLKRYMNDIEMKLNARNRVQAVANAAKQGLI